MPPNMPPSTSDFSTVIPKGNELQETPHKIISVSLASGEVGKVGIPLSTALRKTYGLLSN